MTLDTLIMFAGAFVATLPFLGFPNSWDKVLLFVVGAFIVALGVVVRRRMSTEAPARYNNADTFVESTPQYSSGHEA